MQEVRPAAVAGMFYPDDPNELRAQVDAFVKPGPAAKAIIAPHAGYVYSGPIAGSVFGRVGKPQRVLLLGPAHRLYFEGVASTGARVLRTPLGDVRTWETGAQPNPRAHAQEHCLEVELPFIQRTLPGVEVAALLVGDADPQAVARLIDEQWTDGTLVIVSSDLSHYLPYAEAQRVDRGTADQVLALDPTLTHDQACGATPVNALLLVAKQRGLKVELVDLRNSGDTAGDKSRVVGYAGFTIS